ncbi:MAG TPA: tetratricopeptide repeat protein [Candidatus Kapabacteria bacterium]|nr:tetratricopeptide repeat protein [Candidatus Kapabacteria bacterium]
MLVGRENELNVLNTSFRQMLEGKGNILFLTGEAGLGKTTLVHEWWKTVAPDSAIYAEAACSIPIGNVDVGRLEALQPWADVIAQLQAHEEQGKKKLDLKKLIHDAAPAWAWALPFVGEVAHAAIETYQLVKEQQEGEHNPNAQNQQQVFQQYVNLISKVAEETPLVILLDDLHWADTSSINLLFYLSRQIATKKILVLATYRTDDAIASNDGKGHPIISVKNEILRYESGKELPLGYLNSDAIEELLKSKFGDYQVDDTFEGWLRNISDGNSLFVTQFIKTLQEDGHLDQRGTFIGDYDSISIPTSALAVVTERTRRLDDETRELLSYATAEGEEFTSYVLGQLTSKKPLEVLRDLRKAEAAGLVQSKKSTRQFANQTTSVFGFSHALFHKALYDGLLPEERNILHRQCFDILKAEWDRQSAIQDKSMPLASKLLTHAEKCGEIESAAGVALEAAKGAWQTYAEAEALEMLAHVFRLAAANPSFPAVLRIDALSLLEDIHELHGRYEEALAVATEALERSSTLHDDARAAAAMSRIGIVHQLRGAYIEALEYFTKSLAIRESIGNSVGIAMSLSNIGGVYLDRGAYDEALKYFTKSLAIHESIGNRAGIAGALGAIGYMHQFCGAYDEALEYLVKSLAIRESLDDREGIATMLNNIGIVHGSRGAYDEALEYFTKSLAIGESIGNRAGIAMSLSNIGSVHVLRDAYEWALEYFTKALAIEESIGDRNGIAKSLANIGVMQRKQGKLAEARAALVKAKNIGDEIRSEELSAHVLCELGLLSEAEAKQSTGNIRRDKMNEAASILEEGLAILREIKSGLVKQYETELEKIKKVNSA